MSLTSLKFSKAFIYSFLSILIFSFFAFNMLQAKEVNNHKQGKNFAEHIKTKFTKEGGSAEGLVLVEKYLDNSKKGMLSIKKEIKPLRTELKKVIKADKFDDKAFLQTKEKINNVMLKYMQSKDKELASLFKQLNTKDRNILSKIFNKMFF